MNPATLPSVFLSAGSDDFDRLQQKVEDRCKSQEHVVIQERLRDEDQQVLKKLESNIRRCDVLVQYEQASNGRKTTAM